MTDGSRWGITLLLRYKPPYDWGAMLSFLDRRAIPGVETVSGSTYSRTIEIDGSHGIVSIEPGTGHTLRVNVRGASLMALPWIVGRVRRVFDLAADPEAIGARLREDPVMASLVVARPGLRVPGAWEGFELAVRAVLGQQITVRAAVGLAGRLVAAYGEALECAGRRIDGLTHLFPRPERLASADLSALGMPRSRAEALSAVAAAVVSNPEVIGPGRTLDETVTRLRGLAGVGEWTAQYIAMRALGEPDAFPAADVGLMRALTDQAGRRPTSTELLKTAERWRPWRAYAAQHLWASLAMAQPDRGFGRARGEAQSLHR
jgi:AraC family transcriptional regulator of adaptative response / DNA-3-methyladenine glycosylase II